jgi:hypothetical protein
MSIKKAAQSFVNSPDFADAIAKSTQAGFGGSGYSVELFPDGSHRVLWDNQIGNLYQSPGVILKVPQVSQSDLEDCELQEAAEFYAEEWKDEFIAEL